MIELYDILVALENFTDDELQSLAKAIDEEMDIRLTERIFK